MTAGAASLNLAVPEPGRIDVVLLVTEEVEPGTYYESSQVASITPCQAVTLAAGLLQVAEHEHEHDHCPQCDREA